MKDPYRERAEQHKKPLEKVTHTSEAESGTPQRPVQKAAGKNKHYPLITAILIFFIASPFLVMSALKEEKPAVNQVVSEPNTAADQEEATGQ